MLHGGTTDEASLLQLRGCTAAASSESHLAASLPRAAPEQESQELFELYVSDYIPLQRCSEELLHLKALWDTVGAVMFTFQDWYRWVRRLVLAAGAGRARALAGSGS
jgi:hypothetical protein